MITIEQIKEALRQHIAEAEAATPGLWIVCDKGDDYSIQDSNNRAIIGYDFYLSEPDAAFIAHARTMSPAACKCLLLAIEGLEQLIAPCACLADSAQFSEGYERGWLLANDEAHIALESICQEWHNQTK